MDKETTGIGIGMEFQGEELERLPTYSKLQDVAVDFTEMVKGVSSWMPDNGRTQPLHEYSRTSPVTANADSEPKLAKGTLERSKSRTTNRSKKNANIAKQETATAEKVAQQVASVEIVVDENTAGTSEAGAEADSKEPTPAEENETVGKTEA